MDEYSIGQTHLSLDIILWKRKKKNKKKSQPTSINFTRPWGFELMELDPCSSSETLFFISTCVYCTESEWYSSIYLASTP